MSTQAARREAEAHYARQAALIALALRAVRRAFSLGEPVRAVPVLTVIQRESARDGAHAARRMLAAQEIDARPAGTVQPDEVVAPAARRARLIIADDFYDDLPGLERFAATEVKDAARVSAGIEIAQRPGVGYVRMVNPPCCARCAILAGKFYKWNDGFLRHPLCQCIHIPATENTADDLRMDPMRLFREGKIRGLSAADNEAIEAGADLNQVVNAKRDGLSTTSLFRHKVTFTREGVTRHGLYGSKSRERFPGDGPMAAEARQTRLTPESILDIARDRDEAVRLLTKYGYIL